MRPLGVHLTLKSWTLWSTREGGERIVINYYQPLSDTSGFYFLSTSTKHHIMFITWSSC